MGRLITFASLALRLVPPKAGTTTSELVFRTAPAANKIEIQRYLEALYGLKVQKVTTANYEGKKKRAARGAYGFMRLPDWKKVWVKLREPVTVPENAFVGIKPTEEKAESSQKPKAKPLQSRRGSPGIGRQ